MTDFGICVILLAMFALITALVASRYERPLRTWMWIAFIEWLLCAVVQYPFGADAQGYRQDGMELARLLDADFDWTSREVGLLLFQKPNAFDRLIDGAGTNTGSMSAMAGWIIFIVRGSPYGSQALIAGLSMCSALAMFETLRSECPDVPSIRLFFATVLFPSIAFWTATLHKEAFCLIGMGLSLSAWRAARQRRLRALIFGTLGITLIALFRAPVLPPLLLGLLLHFVISRIKKASGAEFAVLGPFYLGTAFAVLALGMILLTRISPDLALDKLGDSVQVRAGAWSRVEGGSSFEMTTPTQQGLPTQLLMSPLAFFNAAFRPQLFDVRNPLMLVSALEMTMITAMLVRAIMIHGVSGLVREIQRSPFLTMCAVITFVGLTFVGLTTRNYGSLARYRVPFLPFYGSLLTVLTVQAKRSSVPRSNGDHLRPRPPAPPPVKTGRMIKRS